MIVNLIASSFPAFGCNFPLEIAFELIRFGSQSAVQPLIDWFGWLSKWFVWNFPAFVCPIAFIPSFIFIARFSSVHSFIHSFIQSVSRFSSYLPFIWDIFGVVCCAESVSQFSYRFPTSCLSLSYSHSVFLFLPLRIQWFNVLFTSFPHFVLSNLFSWFENMLCARAVLWLRSCSFTFILSFSLHFCWVLLTN